jgi:acyl-CoA thioesterase YciA
MNFTKLVMMQDLNPGGNLFGGVMMSWMDKATAIAAMEYTGTNCVTYIVDQLKFKAPVKLGDVVKIEVGIEEEGKSSLTVSATAYKKKVKELESSYTEVCEAKFIYVALDDEGKKTEIWPNREYRNVAKGV